MGPNLLDHLVGGGQKRFGDGEAERRRSLHVDHQFDLGGLLDWQIRQLVSARGDGGSAAGENPNKNEHVAS
jgi:hypothetical protein